VSEPLPKFAPAAHVDREEPFLQGCRLEEVAVGLVSLGGAGADGLEVVAEFEELLEEFLGLDRIRFEDLFLEVAMRAAASSMRCSRVPIISRRIAVISSSEFVGPKCPPSSR
jgi:hypothetical protein